MKWTKKMKKETKIGQFSGHVLLVFRWRLSRLDDCLSVWNCVSIRTFWILMVFSLFNKIVDLMPVNNMGDEYNNDDDDNNNDCEEDNDNDVDDDQ